MGWLADIWDNIKFERQYRAGQRKRKKIAAETAKHYSLLPSEPPPDTRFDHHLTLHCSRCQAQGALFVDKFLAHIQSMRDALELQCAYCGEPIRGGGIATNEIDAEVLAFWMADDESYLLSQDEDLILADVDDSALIDAIAKCDAEGSWKVQSLIEGLMVSYTDNDYSAQDTAAAEQWLRANPDRWDKEPAWAYIRERVHLKLDA